MTVISLAERVKRIKPSPTLSLNARVQQLKAEGQDIINLTVGEPEFDTPMSIKEAGIKALKEGYTKYTAVDGIPALKKAIIKKFERENHLNYAINQIMVSAGCKQAIYNLAQALLNDGDEAIIPGPYWVSYPDIVFLAGGKPVYVPSTIEQNFKISSDQLEKAITPKTKLLLLNSPSNPSGMVYSKSELAAFAEVLLRHPQVLIASDDIYEHIQWTGSPFVNIVNVCPELQARTLVLNGVSKSYAMTGWRIGYCAGPAEIIKAMTNIQSQSTSNPTAMAQVAAQAALEGPQDCILEMQTSYYERAKFSIEKLREIPGVKCLMPEGAFYIFADFSAFIDRIPGVHDDISLAEYLLLNAKVAVVPGSPFGNPGCLRISTTLSFNLLKKAMQQMSDALK